MRAWMYEVIKLVLFSLQMTNVKLQSNDGQVHVTTLRAAQMSGTIEKMYRQLGTNLVSRSRF